MSNKSKYIVVDEITDWPSEEAMQAMAKKLTETPLEGKKEGDRLVYIPPSRPPGGKTRFMEETLRDMAAKGKRVGIIGHVDHGKTTLTSALMRLAAQGLLVQSAVGKTEVTQTQDWPDAKSMKIESYAPMQIHNREARRAQKAQERRSKKWRR